MTNRTLFALLLATIVIPLPAMTPALLSSAMGAMTLVASAPPPPQATVPVYFIPTRAGPRPPAMVPETVVLSISDPATVITEVGVDRALPFEDLRIPAIVAFEPRMPNPLTLLIGRPGGGGGVTAKTPSAVPEPATWAMLIAGFALAGSFIRRRRAAASAAAAL